MAAKCPRLIVVGRSGAGKSRLLNAILGEPVFRTGVRPTTTGFDFQPWETPWGRAEVIDSRGFSEADAGDQVAHGTAVIEKAYNEAHVCLLVIPAPARDLERESEWLVAARTAGLFSLVPVFLVVTRIDVLTPARDWRPETLDLETPQTAKERNIRAYLDYLKSLQGFRELFAEENFIAVSAGQPAPPGESTDLEIKPYGITKLQDRIFAVLPDASQTEFARTVRKIDLVKASVDKLISSYVWKNIGFGLGLLGVIAALLVVAAGLTLVAGAEHVFGRDNGAMWAAVDFLGILMLICAVPLPIYLQYQMVKEIGRRHGFPRLGLFHLWKLTRRHPGVFVDFKLKKAHRRWIVVGILSCNPLIVGASMTASIANCFNLFFYRCRLREAEAERAQSFGRPTAEL